MKILCYENLALYGSQFGALHRDKNKIEEF